MSAAEAPSRTGGVFSPLTAVLMVLVGVFAFSALVVLLIGLIHAIDLLTSHTGGIVG